MKRSAHGWEISESVDSGRKLTILERVPAAQIEERERFWIEKFRESRVSLLNRTLLPPVQITTLPPYPKGKAVRWNLWILDMIRDEIGVLAAERGVSPSQLVQELLWRALRERRGASPEND